VPERQIEANGVELSTDAFGEPQHPAILLIMGSGASMLWWEEDFCRILADAGRLVIRYDHRDTGRSVTYEPGCPEYTAADLLADAAGVLDAYALAAAHIVGVSAGGAFAQLLALDAPDRVLSLTLISTTAAVPLERELPPPTHEFGRFFSTAEVDWSDADSVIDYLVDYTRLLAGGERSFDEDAARDLMRREVRRACNFAARQNHDQIPARWAPARAALVDRGARARHPRHRRPDVPTRARRSARERDPRRPPAPTPGSRPRGLPTRLGEQLSTRSSTGPLSAQGEAPSVGARPAIEPKVGFVPPRIRPSGS
jgi:pimeloyl-ACP methyl ester carboxylesterase